MDPIHTETHLDHTIEIHIDEIQRESPREWSPLGTFWTMERGFNSPDTIPGGNLFQAMADKLKCRADWDSIAKKLEICAVWLPVWKYQHSGVQYVAAESNPFSCPWDSGQAGLIFVMREDVRAEYGVTRVTEGIKARALDVLKSEVAVYSSYANGEVYGYRVLDSDGEEVDACWGYVGEYEHALSEARDVVSRET